MGKEKLHNLTTLRFFAAFSVFLHHLAPFDLDLSRHVWNLNFGWTVSFFYVLSGFVLSYSYSAAKIEAQGGILAFIVVRFFRLWPLHIACAALMLTVRTVEFDLDRIYLFLLLLHSWVPKYPSAFYINAVSWSISVEWFFYILFPFVIIQRTRAIALIFAAWMVAAYGFLTLVAVRPDLIQFDAATGREWWTPGVSQISLVHLFPPIRFVEFLAGMMVFQVYRRYRVDPANVPMMHAAGLALIVAGMAVQSSLPSLAPMFSASGKKAVYELGMWPLFAVLVYIFAHQSGPIARALSHRYLVYLGTISFALYMVHPFAIRVVSHVLGLQALIGNVAAAGVALGLALLLSSALYHYVETPCLKWARRTFEAGKEPGIRYQSQAS